MGENLAFCVVPVEWLERLKRDIRTFREREELNGFQQWILEKRYILDPPDVDFQVRSLVVAASKYELRDACLLYTSTELSLPDHSKPRPRSGGAAGRRPER